MYYRKRKKKIKICRSTNLSENWIELLLFYINMFTCIRSISWRTTSQELKCVSWPCINQKWKFSQKSSEAVKQTLSWNWAGAISKTMKKYCNVSKQDTRFCELVVYYGSRSHVLNVSKKFIGKNIRLLSDLFLFLFLGWVYASLSHKKIDSYSVEIIQLPGLVSSNNRPLHFLQLTPSWVQ